MGTACWRHLVFSHVQPKKTISRKDAKIAKKTSPASANPEIIAAGSVEQGTALRQVGFQANRRLLDVQTISHDCSIGEDAFDQVVRPIEVDGQRASALRFGDARVQALLSVLVLFSFQLRGFTNQEMRALLAQLLGHDPAHYPAGRMTYNLRRLRLHGIIQRIPKSHRYDVTPAGLCSGSAGNGEGVLPVR